MDGYSKRLSSHTGICHVQNGHLSPSLLVAEGMQENHRRKQNRLYQRKHSEWWKIQSECSFQEIMSWDCVPAHMVLTHRREKSERICIIRKFWNLIGRRSISGYIYQFSIPAAAQHPNFPALIVQHWILIKSWYTATGSLSATSADERQSTQSSRGNSEGLDCTIKDINFPIIPMADTFLSDGQGMQIPLLTPKSLDYCQQVSTGFISPKYPPAINRLAIISSVETFNLPYTTYDFTVVNRGTDSVTIFSRNLETRSSILLRKATPRYIKLSYIGVPQLFICFWVEEQTNGQLMRSAEHRCI